MNNKIVLIFLILSLNAIAQEKIDVAVNVDFLDGSQYNKCITIDEGSNAYDAIKKAGRFGLKDYGWGHAICNIQGEGCPTNNCFCGGWDFWNFWVNDGMPPVGIDDYTLSDRDVISFTWGGWGSNPPSGTEFTEICIQDETGKWTPRLVSTQIPETLEVGTPVSIYVHRAGQKNYPEPKIELDIVPIDQAEKWRPKDRISKAEKILSAVGDFAGKLSFTPSITGNYMLFIHKDGVEPLNYSVEVKNEVATTTTTTPATTTTTRIEWEGEPMKITSWWLPGWYNYEE